MGSQGVGHNWPTKRSTVLLNVGTEFVCGLPLNLPTATQSANSSHFTEKETKAGKTVTVTAINSKHMSSVYYTPDTKTKHFMCMHS